MAGGNRQSPTLAPRNPPLTLHPVPSLDQAIERLYDLNVGTTPLEEGPPHEYPHKPLLLLAVFDLLDEDLAALG